MDLELIEDSTRDIVVAELDTYFPVGPSYNTKHQLWVVGYTMENEEGEHGIQGKSQELGPSFITIFDAEWSQLQTIQLNNSAPAFRVMTQTEGDDIYIVYDEMVRQPYHGHGSNVTALVCRNQFPCCFC